eukprot:359240-Chlamydomonas_euryale.AAC.14
MARAHTFPVVGMSQSSRSQPGLRVMPALLQSGERVMSDEEATFMAVHPGFPDDAWYLPGQGRYWSNNLDE